MCNANHNRAEELTLVTLHSAPTRHRTKPTSDLPSFLRLSPSPLTSPDDVTLANGGGKVPLSDGTGLLEVSRTRSGDDSAHDAGDEASPVNKNGSWSQLKPVTSLRPNGEASCRSSASRRKLTLESGASGSNKQQQLTVTSRHDVISVEPNDASSSSCDLQTHASTSNDVTSDERYSMQEFAERYFNLHPVTHRHTRGGFVKLMGMLKRNRKKVGTNTSFLLPLPIFFYRHISWMKLWFCIDVFYCLT